MRRSIIFGLLLSLIAGCATTPPADPGAGTGGRMNNGLGPGGSGVDNNPTR